MRPFSGVRKKKEHAVGRCEPRLTVYSFAPPIGGPPCCNSADAAWHAAQRPQKRPCNMGGFAFRSRPSCRPVSPILKHVFGGFATPLAALAPARVVPTQSNRQLLSALNPSQTCTRKGGANPKATRGILPHKPPIRLEKSVKQCFGAYCNPSSKYGANFRQVCFKPQANSARPSLKQKRHTHRYAA